MEWVPQQRQSIVCPDCPASPGPSSPRMRTALLQMKSHGHAQDMPGFKTWQLPTCPSWGWAGCPLTRHLAAPELTLAESSRAIAAGLPAAADSTASAAAESWHGGRVPAWAKTLCTMSGMPSSWPRSHDSRAAGLWASIVKASAVLATSACASCSVSSFAAAGAEMPAPSTLVSRCTPPSKVMAGCALCRQTQAMLSISRGPGGHASALCLHAGGGAAAAMQLP